MTMAGFYWIIYLFITGQVEIKDPNLLVMIGAVLGYTSSKADVVVNYLFGSSKNSTATRKTDMLPADTTKIEVIKTAPTEKTDA